MSYTMTRTRSQAIAEVYVWSNAQVRSVGERILDDLLLLVGRGFITQSTALDWFRDLAYLLDNAAAERIEVQLTVPVGARYAVRYDLVHGGLFLDANSGGLDLYRFPDGTKANLLVSYRQSHPRLELIRQEMARRGWSAGGTQVTGNALQDRSYSKDGVGVRRSLIGNWQ